MLTSNDLHIKTITGKKVLHGASFSLAPQAITVITGANGSGKSSLALTILGHPHYQITEGSLQYNGTDMTSYTPEERARMGIFLTMQHPIELPGISLRTLMLEAYRAWHGTQTTTADIEKSIESALDFVGLSQSFATRHVHVGASGGERKRLEIAQALILAPQVVIFDEIDAGLDPEGIDMLVRCMAHLQQTASTSFLIISHNNHLVERLEVAKRYHCNQGVLTAV